MIEVNNVQLHYFRSKPTVNMNPDMIRVTMDVSKNDWYKLRHKLLTIEDENENQS